MSINWDSAHWGETGYNVHEDSSGSWTHADNDNEDN